jgi:hypothetical protein
MEQRLRSFVTFGLRSRGSLRDSEFFSTSYPSTTVSSKIYCVALLTQDFDHSAPQNEVSFVESIVTGQEVWNIADVIESRGLWRADTRGVSAHRDIAIRVVKN